MIGLPSAEACRRCPPRSARIRDRARIELPLPALDAVVARLADELRPARRAPAPSAPSRSGRRAGRMPPQRREVEFVRRQRRRVGCDHPAVASRMPPGTGGRSALRRDEPCGRLDAAARTARAKPSPIRHRSRRAASGQSYIGKRGDELRSCRAIVSAKGMPGWQVGRPSFLRRLGRNRRRAGPETMRARTRGRKARPGSGARRSAGWTTGSFGLKAYSLSSAR